MERSCRVCRNWHSMDDGWPEACMAHWRPTTARSSLPSPMVMRDIDPYQSMITGEMVTGRRQHRDHLKAHGCIEVGNETPQSMKASPKASRRENLHRQMADVSDKQANKLLKQLKKELHV